MMEMEKENKKAMNVKKERKRRGNQSRGKIAQEAFAHKINAKAQTSASLPGHQKRPQPTLRAPQCQNQALHTWADERENQRPATSRVDSPHVSRDIWSELIRLIVATEDYP